MLSIFIFSCSTTLAQQDLKVDSLENIIKNSKNDSIKSRAYSRLYFHFIDFDLDKAGEYAIKKLEFANKLNDPYFQLAAYRVIGDYAFEKKEYIAAKKHIKQAIAYAKQLNDTVRLGITLTTLGLIHDNLGDFIAALDAYQRALMISEKYDDKESISLLLTNMGVLHSNQGDYEKGIELFKKSNAVYETQNDRENMSTNLGNIGALYDRWNKYEEALDYMKQCYELKLQVGEKSEIAWSEGNLGSTYAKVGDIDNALKYNRSALLKYIDLKDENGQSFIYFNLGDAYNRNKQYKHSIINFQKSRALAQKTGDFENLKNAYEGLSKVYEAIGDYRNAYEYHKFYKQFQDSIFNIERNKRINELTAAYDAETKENEISNLQKNQQLDRLELAQEKNKKNILLLASSLLGLVVISVLIFTLQLNKNKSRLENMNKQLVNSENELAKLNETKDRFFAIIAHDLRGAVTSFQGIGQVIKNHLDKNRIERIENVAERIDSSASQLNSLLDNLLNWSVSQLGNIPFHPKKLNLHGAIADAVNIFQEAANAKSIDLSFDIDENAYVMADQNGLSVVLRNLINNALKFTNEGGKVNIVASQEGELIGVKVCDSGVGMSEGKLKTLFLIDETKSTSGTKGEKGTGLGLTLVHEFVKLHHGKIDVDSKPNQGTTFHFSLPMA